MSVPRLRRLTPSTTDQAAIAMSRRAARRRALRGVPWVLAVPALLAMLLIRVAPSIAGGVYAFTNWNGTGLLNARWVGLSNFISIFHSSVTSDAFVHTFELAGLLVVLANVFGLLLALSLRQSLKTRTLLRALFFLPFALSQLATAYIWQFIFQYSGPLNDVLRGVGLSSWQRTWLADSSTALFGVLVVIVWQFIGLTMIIYLAGLQGISEELDDAAAVDGASAWMKFRRITFPLIAPAITVSTTLTLVFGLGAFEQVIALTGGGPVNVTETLATQVYKNTFVYGNFGYGAAFALMLAAIVTVLALTQVAVLRWREARL
ncbi:MAG: sugar ABC transporter permease [Acidimicrobiaceae bacterium]|nr:sugar ABC transporter permease [Acidimicrobiaceae bacterium]